MKQYVVSWWEWVEVEGPAWKRLLGRMLPGLRLESGTGSWQRISTVLAVEGSFVFVPSGRVREVQVELVPNPTAHLEMVH